MFTKVNQRASLGWVEYGEGVWLRRKYTMKRLHLFPFQILSTGGWAFATIAPGNGPKPRRAADAG